MYLLHRLHRTLLGVYNDVGSLLLSLSRMKTRYVFDRDALLYGLRKCRCIHLSYSLFSDITHALLDTHLSSWRRFGRYRSFFSIHHLCSETMNDIDYGCIVFYLECRPGFNRDVLRGKICSRVLSSIRNARFNWFALGMQEKIR